MSTPSAPNEPLLLGRLGSPFGIKGQIKLNSISSHPEHVAKLKTVLIGPKLVPYRILQAIEHKHNVFLIRLEGIDTRTAAEALQTLEVFIRAVDAAPLEAEEYFLHDVPGMLVRTIGGEEIGPVEEVLETGANDVLLVRRADGSEALIPVIRSVIKEFDVPGRAIMIDPLPGMFD